MKLHSNTLTESDIRAALKTVRTRGDVVGGIGFTVLEAKPSRSRANGFEVRLGSTFPDGIHKRRTMDGQDYAATYAEWGYFIAELFARDNEMRFGMYKTEQEFQRHTRYAFC